MFRPNVPVPVIPTIVTVYTDASELLDGDTCRVGFALTDPPSTSPKAAAFTPVTGSLNVTLKVTLGPSDTASGDARLIDRIDGGTSSVKLLENSVIDVT